MCLIRDKEVEAVDGNYKHTLCKNTSWLPNTICIIDSGLAQNLCVAFVHPCSSFQETVAGAHECGLLVELLVTLREAASGRSKSNRNSAHNA